MANSDYKSNGRSAAFAPLAELHDPLDYLDRTLVLGRSNFPRVDALKIGMAALCDEEFMAITAIAPGTVAVKRGCADTVPARHVALSLVWFVDNGVTGSDEVEHSAGETKSVKYSPFTTGGNMAIEDGNWADQVTFNWRMYRPYPPAALRARGERWYIEQTLSADNPFLPLTWAHRDRILQSDQLVDHDEPNVGPEPGTSYTVRVYDRNNVLKRTEVGIMAEHHDMYGNFIEPAWTYTWQQAMLDLNIGASAELGQVVSGHLTIFSTRDGFDSWQGYEIPFKVNTQGFFMKVAQAAQIVGQAEDMDATGGPYPPNEGMYAGQAAHLVAQPLGDAENNAGGPTSGMYVASLHEGVGQQTNFYTNLNRNMFEAPYAHLLRRASASATKLVTVTARPSDRLTDEHAVWTRYDYPQGWGGSFAFTEKMEPEFTPWITLAATIGYLDTTILIDKSSFNDGVSLSNVQVGQVAMIDQEIVRIDARDATTLTIARGCFDTVPTVTRPHTFSAVPLRYPSCDAIA
jgi:hypothetical protein